MEKKESGKQVPFFAPMSGGEGGISNENSRQTGKDLEPVNQSSHERRKDIWKKIVEKDSLRMHWLLLCAALRSIQQELLQQQPRQTEHIRSRRIRRYRVRRAKRDVTNRTEHLRPQ